MVFLKANELAARGWKQWKPGDPLLINRIVWNEPEIANVLDVFDRDWFASGHYVNEFQKALSQHLDGGTFFLTNSGSTALETAVMALMKHGKIAPGDMVLHPALTFNTSASCFAKFDMTPVFVDSDPGTYNANVKQMLDMLEAFPIGLIVLPHILGNTTDIDLVMNEAHRRNISVIGDSCDTMGTKWNGEDVGAWTDFTAYSFYGSHHITTAGVGGTLRVNDPRYENTVKSLIYWGRDWEAEQNFGNRYAYATLGSDYQMTEIQAAFGLAQLGRLEELNKRRESVFNRLLSHFIVYELDKLFILPKSHAKARPSWFGFPLTIRDGAPFNREQFINGLLARKIECRPMFSGNTANQKAWQGVYHITEYPLKFATKAQTDSFFLPAWAMPDEAVAYLIDSIDETIKELVDA